MEELQLPKLDYNLKTEEERKQCVNTMVAVYQEAGREFTNSYLQIIANYLLLLDVPKVHKDRKVLTPNRLKTINLRETSYESLAESLPGGEDEINNLIETNPKTFLLTQKQVITDEDIKNIPGLKDLLEGIAVKEKALETAEGRAKFLLKKNLIEDHKTKFILKQDYINYTKPLKRNSGIWGYNLTGEVSFDPDGTLHNDTAIIRLDNPEHIKTILNNYSYLKEETYGDFEGYMLYLIWSVEDLIDEYIKDKDEILFEILVRKIDGMSGKDIIEVLNMKFGVDYNENKISKAWCQTIPNIISEAYIKKAMISWWEQHNWPMKTCNKCGQTYPLNPLFFHRNNALSDGFFNICKSCRNKKK